MASSSVKSSFSRADFAESQPSQWSKKQGRAVLRTRILNNSRRAGLCLVGKHNLDNELPFPNSGKVRFADHPPRTSPLHGEPTRGSDQRLLGSTFRIRPPSGSMRYADSLGP